MSDVRNNVNQGVRVGLIRVANLVSNTMKKRLASGYPPGNPEYGWVPIQDTITIGQVSEGNGQSSITISLGGERAPYAAAYEWGSGIHKTRGSPGTYVIKPRDKGALAFYWPGHESGMRPGKKFIMYGNDGRLLFTYIDHPGVEAKPYIEPSIQENKQEVKKILAREFKMSLLIGREKVTEITVGV